MVRKIIFNDEITLWWEYQREIKTSVCYLNGEVYAEIASTHVSFTGLSAETDYQIKIVAQNGVVLFDEIVRTKPEKQQLDVTKAPYCAVGDGKTMNTAAIQRALDDCKEDAYVYIPEGTFLTGALRMRSNTELYLQEDAVLQGTDALDAYLPKIRSRFEGLEFMCYASLINAGELDSKGGANCYNIAIRGKGKIIGGGNALRQKVLDAENERLKEYIASLGDEIKTFETTDTIAGRFRGRLINFSNVDGAIVSGVEFGSSPAWNLHMVYSQNLTVYGCRVNSHNISNGDGIDPDSVENCAIFGCVFDTSDDSIAIKSGRNPEGNVVNRKTSKVYIFDCEIGGNSLAIGSEMSGGVEDVTIWDCDVRKGWGGIHIKFTKKRGGYIKNIAVYRCKCSCISIAIPSYNDDGEGAPTVPVLDGLTVEDCELYGSNVFCAAGYVYLQGLDDGKSIKNVSFKNIHLKDIEGVGKGCIVIKNVENITFENIVSEK